MGQDFAHLHVHTEYSLLDGFSRIKKLVGHAKEQGMCHLAITDHGAMYGVLEFYKACLEGGISPVLGVEGYLVDDMQQRLGRGKEDYTHQLLLAKNQTGYNNLLKLTTIAHTEGFYGKPRMSREILAAHADGLIATSTCLGGDIPQRLLKNDLDGARQSANWYREVFGTEGFFFEIQNHLDSSVEQDRVNQHLFTLHKEMGIPLVVTNDLHYVAKEDAPAQDVLLCVSTGKQLDDANRMKFPSDEFYLKSPAEMALLFPELPDALTNSVRIAEMCQFTLDFGKQKLPQFQVPEGFAGNDETYLRHLCNLGAERLYGGMNEAVRERMEYELKVIVPKGFCSYFLVVWDFINYARSFNMPCAARGSAAGSIVAYLLGITNVDPLRYGLLFERFLNAERMDLPDIDADIPDVLREKVIRYVTQKYGTANVAQMVTFNTLAAKASVKDTARVMGLTSIGEKITQLIPTRPHITLQKSMDEVRELKQLYDENTSAKRILDQAMQLEGAVRNTGIHAAGVIISPDPLENWTPLQLIDRKNPEAGRAAQYEQAYLDNDLQLVKMDLLGLSNLTMIGRILEVVQETRHETIVLEKIPLDDAPTFRLLSDGFTTNLFQLESPPMTRYIKQLQPTCIEDITAMVALYRPGPMESIPDFIDAKQGRKQVQYLDPRLQEWLEESYGIIVYQDQVLLIAVHLAGFSWGKVNKFRKVLSKKIQSEVNGYKEDFIAGCIKNHVAQEVAERLFELIMPFGGYGFNKAHAASYATIAYWSAYLKQHYTSEFMAAALTMDINDATKVARIITDCTRMDVRVLGPDVNKSDVGFVGENGNVRFGLKAIKGIGEGPTSAIVHARETGGIFTSLADFCIRVDPKAATRSIIETLIKAGAMDSLGQRHQLLDAVERAITWGKIEREVLEQGLTSLFGEMETVANAFTFTLNERAAEISRQQLLVWEKELLGLYISDHPIKHLETAFAGKTQHDTSMLHPDMEKQKVSLGGMIIEVRKITTKKGDSMCIARLEDQYGIAHVTVFPRTYEQNMDIWQEGAIVIVRGEVQIRNDEVLVLCESVEPLENAEQEMNRKQYRMLLTFHAEQMDARALSDYAVRIQSLYDYLHAHPGRDSYEVVVHNGKWQAMLAIEESSCEYSETLRKYCVDLLGEDMIKVEEVSRT